MNKSLYFVLAATAAVSGCSSSNKACEDVNVAAEQVQHCQALQRQITQAKDQPIVRTELERRFETDCIDVRYYRDDQQVAICDNKQEIEREREKIKQQAAEQN